MNDWRKRLVYQSLRRNQARRPPLPSVLVCHHSPLFRDSVFLPCFTQRSIAGTASAPQRLTTTAIFLIYSFVPTGPNIKQALMPTSRSIPTTLVTCKIRDLQGVGLDIHLPSVLSAIGQSAVYLTIMPPSISSAIRYTIVYCTG